MSDELCASALNSQPRSSANMAEYVGRTVAKTFPGKAPSVIGETCLARVPGLRRRPIRPLQVGWRAAPARLSLTRPVVAGYGSKKFSGTVTELSKYGKHTYFHIIYEDGDSEDISLSE